MNEEIRGSEGVERDLQLQIKLLGTRVPAYTRLLRVVLQRISGPKRDNAFHQRLESAWHKRSFEAYYSRPLLLLASVRADVLTDGATHPLWPALGEGASDPADMVMVVPLTCPVCATTGTLVLHYGAEVTEAEELVTVALQRAPGEGPIPDPTPGITPSTTEVP